MWVSERKVKLCGFATAVLMDRVNTIDRALEDVYGYVVMGMRQAAIDYVYHVEENIDDALAFLKLAERACGASPEAGKAFEKFASELRGKLAVVRKDPVKAGDYRYYRYHLSEGVKIMLSD